MSGDLPLASRLLLREWRAGELRVMLLALLIAVTVSTAISFFTDRLQRGMVTRAAEFLGADMRLSSRDPWPDEALQEAIKRSEERRVGKECRSRWAPAEEKKKEG